MRISYFETLVRVYESGSVTDTAKKLFISQPAVTKQIKAIEKEYNVDLFVREGNKLVPTKEADVIYRFASKITNYDKEIRDRLDKEAVEGPIELHTSNIPSYQFIPKLLCGYLKEYPEVRPRINTCSSDEVIDAVDRGVVSFGFTGIKKESDELEYLKLFEEEMILVANKEYNQPLENIIKKEMFAIRELGSASLKSFERYLEKFDCALNEEQTLIICSDNEMLKRTALLNDCLAYLPRSWVEEEVESGKLKVLDIGELRDFYYIYNPNTHMNATKLSLHNYVMK